VLDQKPALRYSTQWPNQLYCPVGKKEREEKRREQDRCERVVENRRFVKRLEEERRGRETNSEGLVTSFFLAFHSFTPLIQSETLFVVRIQRHHFLKSRKQTNNQKRKEQIKRAGE
jgi:hypothetical protein